MTFDEVLNQKIGMIGIWQLCVGFMIVTSFDDSMQLIPQLANISPPFVCSAPWFKGWTYHDIINISADIASLGKEERFGINKKTSTPDLKCHRYDLSNIANVLNNTSMEEKKRIIVTSINVSKVTLEKCPGSWRYDSTSALYRHSLIEEFNMVCHRQFLIPFSAIFYTLGMGIGVSICGPFADYYGRRPIMCVTYPLTGFFGTVVAFSKRVEVYFFFRFCIGVTGSMFRMISFIYMLEHMDKKYRNTFSLIDGLFEIAFIRNVALLFSYLIQDYRVVHLILGTIIMTFSFIYFKFYDESPRWLVEKGRYAEALEIIRNAITMNGGTEEEAYAVTQNDICLTSEEMNAGKFGGVRERLILAFQDWVTFIKTPEYVKRWIPLSGMWVTMGCVYYGVLYHSVRLKGNPYIIAFCMSNSAFPARLLQWRLFEKTDKKRTLIGFYFAAFVFCVIGLIAMITGAPSEVIITCVTLVISCSTCLFASLYLVTPELFPPIFRAKSFGFSSAVSRFGVISGLFFERFASFLPMICFSLALAIGLVCCFFLPDTREWIINEESTLKEDERSEHEDEFMHDSELN